MSTNWTTHPVRCCRRCGDPLPSDGKCDCRHDPDRDRTMAETWDGLEHEVAVRDEDGHAGAVLVRPRYV